MKTYVITYRQVWINAWGEVDSMKMQAEIATSTATAEEVFQSYHNADHYITTMPLQETIAVEEKK